mmetsp:Transcript_33180/g.105583  ORF Transcript_33180/g.105583 Transcript_33180/m.105583 type:complete len:201 (-) Transcript_33180:25-627(-)
MWPLRLGVFGGLCLVRIGRVQWRDATGRPETDDNHFIDHRCGRIARLHEMRPFCPGEFGRLHFVCTGRVQWRDATGRPEDDEKYFIGHRCTGIAAGSEHQRSGVLTVNGTISVDAPPANDTDLKDARDIASAPAQVVVVNDTFMDFEMGEFDAFVAASRLHRRAAAVARIAVTRDESPARGCHRRASAGSSSLFRILQAR